MNSGPSNCRTASNGLPALIRDGWMRDAHPPVFNAWATLLASLGITSIPAGRLVSNLLAAGLMILAAVPPVAADARAGRFRRRPAAAHPVAAAGDGVLRRLPILLLADDGDRHARAGRPPCRRDESRSRLAPRPRPGGDRRAGHRRLDRRSTMSARCSAGFWPAPSPSAPSPGGCGDGRPWCWRRRRCRACSSSPASLLQAPSWAADFDHSWIDLPGLAALGVLASLAVAPLWLNPVPLAGLWWRPAGRGRATPRRPGSSP